jgi:dTDP-4-dehydrorhamnose 3,5-epimerase
MEVKNLAIPIVKVLTPRIFRDGRGFFSETWSERSLSATGINARFVQDNHALSKDKGTVRGLHFQIPPCAQGKLVRVVKGSILDVAVDIRRKSPSFGQAVSTIVSAENWAQIWIPEGFAHGYVTLESHTEVIYKVTEYYAPEYDRGIQWDDPALAIDWGVTRENAVLSDKDALLPPLRDAADLFD